MRKLFLSIATVAAVLLTGALADRANAITLGTPAQLLGAAEEMTTVDQVHCRPGWRHHAPTRWRHANGCLRARVVHPHRHRHYHRH